MTAVTTHVPTAPYVAAAETAFEFHTESAAFSDVLSPGLKVLTVGDALVGDALGVLLGESLEDELGAEPCDALGDALGDAVLGDAVVGDALDEAVVGDAEGDAVAGDVGAALGDALGGHAPARSSQAYNHAVLAESESSIARLWQSLSKVVPVNM